MAELRKLKTTRTVEKTRITKTRTFLDELKEIEEESPDTLNKIRAKYDAFNDAKSRYYGTQSEIIQLVADADQETEITELTEMDEKLVEITALFATELEKYGVYLFGRVQEEEEDSVHTTGTSRSRKDPVKAKVRLPEMKIPTFNGDYGQWLDFKRDFNRILGNVKDVDASTKLTYLRSSLIGDAKLTQGEEDTFESLWEALKRDFENVRYILDKEITEYLMEKPMANESSKELRRVLNAAKKHMSAFKTLEMEINPLSQAILIHVLLQKLEKKIRNEFEMKLDPNELAEWSNLIEFLQKKANTLESVEKREELLGKPKKNETPKKDGGKPKILINTQNQENQDNNDKNPTGSGRNARVFRNLACYLCSKNHYLSDCPDFLKLNISDRCKKVDELGLCVNCLKRGHKVESCERPHCQSCTEKHHSRLHNQGPQGTVCSSSFPEFTAFASNGKQVLLHTALIKVYDDSGHVHLCRCLLDSGSMSNLMSERMFQLLNLKSSHTDMSVLGVNGNSTKIKRKVSTRVGSRFSNFELNCEFYVIDKITGNLPCRSFDVSSLKLPPNLKLADTSMNVPGRIDMLIGLGEHKELYLGERIDLGHNRPVAELTQFGYVIGGPLDTTNANDNEGFSGVVCTLVSNEELNDSLKKFWELESVKTKNCLSYEDKMVEDHFIKNVSRYPDGRYCVRLPFNDRISELGNSKQLALKRFFLLEKRLNANPDLKNEYQKFMNEYMSMNHMQLTDEKVFDHDSDGYFLPHHAVVKPSSSSTKVRVVFDGSAKIAGKVSLNEALRVGPVVQNDFRDILIKFRTLKYVFTCDIVKMYRQVWVDQNDRKYQKIFWRNEPSDPLRIWELCTVTYGLSDAPHLATRSLIQLARDEGKKFPAAAEALECDVYVDDCLSGANNLKAAVELRNDLIELLKLGQFEVHKWCANDPGLLHDIPNEKREPLKQIGDDFAVTTLGISWIPDRDQFRFCVSNVEACDDGMITKRKVASQIHKYFDPLGLTGPVGLFPKLFMQNLWVKGYDWDDELDESDTSEWKEYILKLKDMNDLYVDRYIFPSNKTVNIQVHGFADASIKGFGACIYIRSVEENGNVSISLLTSRSRVAPLTAQTIARLELCAAELLIELWDSIKDCLSFEIEKHVWWSDSKITLSWIKLLSRQLNVFVSHRVSKIQEKSNPADWRYVKSQDNPADVLSRGLMPDQLEKCDIWWNGPEFLKLDESEWPVDNSMIPKENLPEIRAHIFVNASPIRSELFTSFSSYVKMIRVTAIWMRFVNNVRAQIRGEVTRSGDINGKDLNDARLKLIWLVQHELYGSEIKALKQGKSIDLKSPLVKLAPFLSENELMRMGGRLENSKFSYNRKHPLILPPNHPFTTMLIRYYHEDNMHVGSQVLLAMIRCKYWILRGRSQVRMIVIRCVKCFRKKPKPSEQMMGQLPDVRVQPSAPFLHSGVDYAGPFNLKISRNTSTKGYIAVFTCMATRSIHLELAGGMSAECFLNALYRFIARRGVCQTMHSDNGTNFVGANNELQELKALFENDKFKKNLTDYCNLKGIEWKFIPPSAPHFGGSWESMVKVTKTLLVDCLGEELLYYEEMHTILTRIEGILNSRPLIPMTEDPNDLCALTPGHFIIGRPLTELAEPDYQDLKINRLTRFQYLCRIKQDFWNKWSQYYLQELQTRHKWHTKVDVKLGQMVVIQEDKVPATQWLLGRIVALHPGSDGVTRVVTVKTVNGEYKRPLAKLCFLPIDDNEQ